MPQEFDSTELIKVANEIVCQHRKKVVTAADTIAALKEAEKICAETKMTLTAQLVTNIPNRPTLHAIRTADAILRREGSPLPISQYEDRFFKLLQITGALSRNVMNLTRKHSENTSWEEVIKRSEPNSQDGLQHILIIGQDSNGCIFYRIETRDQHPLYQGSVLKSATLTRENSGIIDNGNFIASRTCLKDDGEHEESYNTPTTTVEQFFETYDKIYPSCWHRIKNKFSFFRK